MYKIGSIACGDCLDKTIKKKSFKKEGQLSQLLIKKKKKDKVKG